jgi:hypothetical protein
VNKNGNRLDKGEVHRTFYALSRHLGLRAAGATCGPRLHDLSECRVQENAESHPDSLSGAP